MKIQKVRKMKTLKHHTLLYDDQCPLCKAYTGAFIQTGMLDEQGRTLHQEGIETYKATLNVERSCNEIALVNTQTGETTYGLNSLLLILGHNAPAIQRIGQFKPLHAALNTLYKFISFNRKVIAPSAAYRQQTCVPAFHAKYRTGFMLLVALFTSWVLNHYSWRLVGFVPASNLFREYAICFGQIGFQLLCLTLVKARKQIVYDYLGNMMTVSLIGALLLLPALIVTHFVSIAAWAALGYFLLVVTYMLFLHTRRVTYIGAPAWLSISWIVYRLLVLTIIL